jgi:hypothetical protein
LDVSDSFTYAISNKQQNSFAALGSGKGKKKIAIGKNGHAPPSNEEVG